MPGFMSGLMSGFMLGCMAGFMSGFMSGVSVLKRQRHLLKRSSRHIGYWSLTEVLFNKDENTRRKVFGEGFMLV